MDETARETNSTHYCDYMHLFWTLTHWLICHFENQRFWSMHLKFSINTPSVFSRRVLSLIYVNASVPFIRRMFEEFLLYVTCSGYYLLVLYLWILCSQMYNPNHKKKARNLNNFGNFWEANLNTPVRRLHEMLKMILTYSHALSQKV